MHMARRCLKGDRLRFNSLSGKEKKNAQDICVGVSFASFHLILPLIFLTSSLQRR